jgi:ATP-binding cassette, subfamily F, member 3
MFALNNISVEIGSRVLIDNTSWHINANEKIGLIGPNGSGKSTLLRIIAKDNSPSSGDISHNNDLVTGFLNQDLLSYQTERSILKVAMEAFEKVNQLADVIENCIGKLENDHSEALLNKLHEAQEKYDALDGYSCKPKAERILEGLGFSTLQLERPLNSFSGGWRMRVMLAKILLTKPDLLLLDEPTNHLDLPSIKWLEEYLDSYRGTIIIVSHDRYFLDSVVDKIADIRHRKIHLYSGNYSFYLEEKQLQDELHKSRFKNQEKFIKEQEKFINRFRAKSSKAKAVQSRVKMLEKLEHIDDVDDSVPVMSMKLDLAGQPGKTINDIKITDKSYNNAKVFHNTKAQVLRGDKIALIGANGTGKSTLLRLISGMEEFDGTLEDGYNVVKSFFAQHQLESLNMKNSVLEEMRVMAPDESDGKLRTLLGAFLFNGDDVFKKTKILSGGERSRVALAKTMLTKANFLLLDEPTNHLDIQSVNTLIRVLKNFKGSYIVVSHDRFFLAEIANKIWYIVDNEIKEYPGTYAEFDVWQQARKESDKPVKGDSNKKMSANGVPAKKKVKSPVNTKNTEQKAVRKLKSSISNIEDEMTNIESKMEELLSQMADETISSDYSKLSKLQTEYDNLGLTAHQLQEKWDSAFTKLTELE